MTGVAVMAKAPVPGAAKTRLVPAIGAEAAAALQARLTARAVETAVAAAIGPVTLWGAPDAAHPAFSALAARLPISRAAQPDGDLGVRMLAAVAARKGPTLVIGTDCPALTVTHLRAAAEALQRADAVLIPAEDGGYVLIGLRCPRADLFGSIAWGTGTVLAATRARIAAAGLAAIELPPLWDVDTADDLARCLRAFPALAL